MGIPLLVIFVAGSLFLSVWAWRSYDSLPQPEPEGPIDMPVSVISGAAIVLYSCLPELLAHYTKWSFKERAGAAAAGVLLFQYLAIRVLNHIRQKAQDGGVARPT
jgi:hypothetical protein